LIKYYPFFRIWGIPDASPFCVKLETWLRMSKIDYEPVFHPMNIQKAPKGKLPYIKHDGQFMGDSSLIIQYLVEKFGDKLDQHLTSDQRRHALLVQRTLEEHLYWVLIYSRWIDDQNWPVVKKAFFKTAPALVRGLIARKVRGDIIKSAKGHGLGRHESEVIYAMGIQDLEAVTAPLQTQPYMLGDRVSSLDATTFGFLAQIYYPPLDTPLKTWFSERTWLIDYCDKIMQDWFPELGK